MRIHLGLVATLAVLAASPAALALPGGGNSAATIRWPKRAARGSCARASSRRCSRARYRPCSKLFPLAQVAGGEVAGGDFIHGGNVDTATRLGKGAARVEAARAVHVFDPRMNKAAIDDLDSKIQFVRAGGRVSTTMSRKDLVSPPFSEEIERAFPGPTADLRQRRKPSKLRLI